MEYIQYVAAFFGISGAILLVYEFPWPYLGWLAYAIASAIWIVMGMKMGMYGLVITSAFFIVIETRGFIKHLKRHLEEKSSEH